MNNRRKKTMHVYAKRRLDSISDEAEIFTRIRLASFYLDEAASRLNSITLPPLPVLSPRESECLLWSVRGKTSWEIGKILNISEHTVVFHFNNARRKLGATNRQHAISTAISLRLIEP